MSRPCKVCRHPNRESIEGALYARVVPLRDLGQSYNVSKSALSRHRLHHMDRSRGRWWPGPGQKQRGQPEAEPKTGEASKAMLVLYVLEHAEDLSGEVRFLCPSCGKPEAIYHLSHRTWLCNSCASGGGYRGLLRYPKVASWLQAKAVL